MTHSRRRMTLAAVASVATLALPLWSPAALAQGAPLKLGVGMFQPDREKNDATDRPMFPACLPDVVAVAAPHAGADLRDPMMGVGLPADQYRHDAVCAHVDFCGTLGNLNFGLNNIP